MGTDIQEVDYKKLPTYANGMRTEGRKLNSSIISAYTEIGNLSKSWYGVRYDTLVTEVNKLTTDVNAMLDLVVDTIPFTLQTVANNYAKVDGGTTAAATNMKPTAVANVQKSNKQTMRFVESDVSTSKDAIFRNFSNAEKSMDIIQQIFNNDVLRIWRSEAAKEYSKKFTTLKSNISTSIKNVKTSFDKLVADTMNDMKSTESANTVS